ncbi:MAG: complex I NDUFA9 subunit family protein [Alphaproteobacteria bacterium]|nr:complex I NDUFA9 subunit family protein [Rhodospirillaceae bacterium]MDG2480736.1 complex I NDUFA9 subunit family protein [Alphaproteobacteria bacterium]MBT6206065.1 complex I NDUFA9 subunit family protein [Rhodospirillaceae bacterium]MBT6511535.1 complex I NDUFA9 subunit family protein [Rhodospirillaceae bacterium]MBT7612421.1 complex I NDUFA9 subunit family protein [Rhodospirillaceae bacterium]
MARRDVVVFGGSGFIGRYLVRRLADDGWRVIVAVRDPEGAGFLQPMGDVGQIVPLRCDVADKEQVAAVMSGAVAAINLVGILSEWGKKTFRRVHVEGARNIAQAAADAGIDQVIQVSAIGASLSSPSSYARSKATAENVMREIVPGTRVVRPSIIFGAEDGFFNLFGRMASLSPVIPLFGGGMTRFQPVYVDDVAAAIVSCLDDPSAAGRTFELGGPSVYTFHHLMEMVRRETQRSVMLVPMPFLVAHIQAMFLQFWPKPLLTPDQVRLLQIDSVVHSGSAGLSELGIVPTTVEVVVPRYLSLFRRGGLRGQPRFG